jgi:hypothetical protein
MQRRNPPNLHVIGGFPKDFYLGHKWLSQNVFQAKIRHHCRSLIKNVGVESGGKCVLKDQTPDIYSEEN